MKPEHQNADSVPEVGLSVKVLIMSALLGHAVRVHDTGMDVSKEATPDEACASFSELLGISDKTKFHVWFCLGDGYSQMRRRADGGEEWPAFVKKHFGVKVYNELRKAAWVAEKWPKGKRDPEKTWTWHKENAPDIYRYPTPNRPPIKLKILGRHIVDGEEVIHQIDDYGRQYIAKEVLEVPYNATG